MAEDNRVISGILVQIEVGSLFDKIIEYSY